MSFDNLQLQYGGAPLDLGRPTRDPDVLEERARSAENKGQLTEAFHLYERALTLDPSRARIVPRLRNLAGTAAQRRAVREWEKRPCSLLETFGANLRFPFSHPGLTMLGLWALAAFFVRFLAGIPELIWMAVAVGGAAATVFGSYLVSVFQAGAVGEDDPDWDAGNITFRALCIGTALAFAFLPAGIALLAEWSPAVAVIAGLLLLPMAVVMNGVFLNPVGCFNLPLLIRSIAAAGRDYALCLALGVTFLLTGFFLELVYADQGLPLGALIPVSAFEVYAAVALTRMLGRFYHFNQSRLAWDRD